MMLVYIDASMPMGVTYYIIMYYLIGQYCYTYMYMLAIICW